MVAGLNLCEGFLSGRLSGILAGLQISSGRVPQAFRPTSAKFYPASAEACTKILPNFYPDKPQGIGGIFGGPGNAASCDEKGNNI